MRRGCCDVRVLGVLCVGRGLRVGRLSEVVVVTVPRDRIFFEVRRLVRLVEDGPDDDVDDTRFRVADVFAPIHRFSVVHNNLGLVHPVHF